MSHRHILYNFCTIVTIIYKVIKNKVMIFYEFFVTFTIIIHEVIKKKKNNNYKFWMPL